MQSFLKYCFFVICFLGNAVFSFSQDTGDCPQGELAKGIKIDGRSIGCDVPSEAQIIIEGYKDANNSGATYTIKFGDDNEKTFTNEQLNDSSGIVHHQYTKSYCLKHQKNFLIELHIEGCDPTYETDVTTDFKVQVAPQVEFQVSDVCANFPANFDNQSTAGMDQFCDDSTVYEWDFGDGSEVVYMKEPEHKYETPGTYLVTLNAYLPKGKSDCGQKTVTHQITVWPLPVANKPDDLSICAVKTDSIPLTGSGVSYYKWTGGEEIGLADGSTEGKTNYIPSFDAENVTISVKKATIEVTPYNEHGCAGDPVTFDINVKPSPQVNPIKDMIVCDASQVPEQTITSKMSGTEFSWTIDNLNIGLQSSGTGSTIPSFIAVNKGSQDITAKVTVVATNPSPELAECGSVETSYNITVISFPEFEVVKSKDETDCASPNGEIIVKDLVAGSDYEFLYKYNGVQKNTVIKADEEGTYLLKNLKGGSYTNFSIGRETCEKTIQTVLELNGPTRPETPTIKADTVMCVGDSVTFKGSSIEEGVSYKWTGPNGFYAMTESVQLKDLKTSMAGRYNFFVIKNNCPSDTAFVNLKVNKDPSVKLTDDIESCPNVEIDTKKFVSYEWNGMAEEQRKIKWTIEGSPSFTSGTDTSSYPRLEFSRVGTFKVKVEIEGNGCKGTSLESEMNINILDADFDLVLSLDTLVGCGTFDVTVTNQTKEEAGVSYVWSVDKERGWSYKTGNSTSAAPAFTFNQAENYKILLNSMNVCGTRTDSFMIKAYNELSLQLKDINNVCGQYDYDVSEQMQILSGDTASITSIKWSVSPQENILFKQGSATELTPIISFDHYGTYTLKGDYVSACGEGSISAIIKIDEPIDIQLTTFDTLCANIFDEQGQNGVLLKGVPEGGSWSCEEDEKLVNGDYFYPDSSGSFTLIYKVVSNSCIAQEDMKVNVRNMPSIEMEEFVVICKSYDKPIQLKAEPEGGVWAGSNIGDENGTPVFVNPQVVGAYYVSYTIGNVQTGCKARKYKRIVVQDLPSPNFGPVIHCLPGELQFETMADAANTFDWDYGDGQKGTDNKHLYEEPGNYWVHLNVSDGTGCSDSITQLVKVERIPALTLDFDPDSGCSPLSVHFSPYYEASDTVGTSFLWSFGNGEMSRNLADTTVVFNAYGSDVTYYMKLVSENFCGTQEIEDSIFVKAQPGAAFDFEKQWNCSPVEVKLQNKTMGASEGLKFYWDFGDGTSSEERFPTHTFTTTSNKMASYTVKLTAENDCGQDSYEQVVYVRPNEVEAQFLNNDPFICAGDEVCFDNTSLGVSGTDTISLTVWNFGNGLVSNEWNGCTKFEAPGIYPISLKVNNVCGYSEYNSQVQVYESPSLKLKSDDTFCLGDTVSPSFDTDQDIQSVLWTFGDGSMSSNANPHFVYNEAGDYYLKLRIENSTLGACPAEDSLLMHIRPLPETQISSLEHFGCSPLEYEPQVEGSYYWMFDAFGDSSFTSQKKYVYENNGTETLVYKTRFLISDAYGCESQKDGYIAVYPHPKAYFETKVESGHPEKLILMNKSTASDMCRWTLPYKGEVFGCEDQIEEFWQNEKKTISLYVESKYGCSDEYEYQHQSMMKGLYFPNTFIPTSNDPKVSTFNGVGIGLKQYKLEIFDLYGNLLYRTTSIDENGQPNEGWDGKDHKGEMVPQDAYHWKAEAVFIDDSVFPSGNSEDKVQYDNGSVLLLIK